MLLVIPPLPKVDLDAKFRTELVRVHCACGYSAVARSVASADAAMTSHQEAVHG